MFNRYIPTILMLIFIGDCAENRASFFIQDMKVPTDECVIPAEKDAVYYSGGTWDVALLSSYHVHPLVINNMSCSKKLNPLTAQSNIIQVDGAWVTVLDSNENELSSEYFVPSPCSVDPEGGATAMDFEAVNSDMYNVLAGMAPGVLMDINYLCTHKAVSSIILRIRVVGVTGGNIDVQTPYFYFPVDVCCGCLVYFPGDTWDESLGTYNCHASESQTTEELCIFDFQDAFVDCRLCAGFNPRICDPATTVGTFCNPWYYCP